MLAFEGVLLRERPDLVVVVGDVNSTLACALTARKLGIRVAHVEAGLRSGDMGMPEEINRRLTDILCDYLFTTEAGARENLVREGIDPNRIFFVGNVMIDTLLKQLRRIEADHLSLPVSTHFKRLFPQYGVLTLHRPSNVDDAATLVPLLEVLGEISRELPVLFPIHPRTAQKIEEFGLAHLLHPFQISSKLKAQGLRRMAEKGNSRALDPGEMGMRSGSLYVTEPLGYLEMLNLTRHARLVLTDSGGLQEETTALGVPCLTLRENTERPITLEVGTNVLVGTNPQRIREEARRALSAEGSRGRIPEKWDGRAAQRIVEIILRGKMGQEGGKCTSSS